MIKVLKPKIHSSKSYSVIPITNSHSHSEAGMIKKRHHVLSTQWLSHSEETGDNVDCPVRAEVEGYKQKLAMWCV